MDSSAICVFFSMGRNQDLPLCKEFGILKFDKTSTDLKCFIFQFGGLGALFEGV